MKTAIEWFETFPEPYRRQAIANCLELTRKYDNASDALGLSFSWEGSPQTYLYWQKFHEKISDKK